MVGTLASPAGTELVHRLGGVRSRVGQRLLALFIACALVPIAVLATWSHQQVRAALVERAQGRLDVMAKEHAVAIVDHVLGIFDLLRALESSGGTAGGLDGARRPRTWVTEGLAGAQLAAEQLRHLGAGRPVMLFDASTPDVVRFVHADPKHPTRYHWGEVPISRLFGFSADEVTDPALCVIDSRDARVLQCSQAATGSPVDALRPYSEDWLISRRAVFLRYEFAAPDLEVAAMRTREEVVAAASRMGSLFVLVAVLSMLVVFLTAHRQIRHITAPLDRLIAATRRMREGERAVQVLATGDDELAQLARGFNTMSTAIARQVGAMAALDEVDRAALDAGDLERVAQAALSTIAGVPRVREALVIIPPERDPGDTLVVRAGERIERVPVPAAMCPVRSGRSFTSAECGGRMAHLGVPNADEMAWLMIPLRHAGRVEGVVAIGMSASKADDDEHFLHQVCDRLAMALANRRLVDELDAFSLGTLTAFARAVDANSAWTAGHSERVTTTAVALGQHLELSTHELDTLRRGGLLHDIGKIGVPAAILDKAGALTPDELAVMQRHPVLGHEILSPIPAMRDVLPIVRHHHERMDGCGYPDGLIGEAIPLLARVLAVADVYDALVSDRPYRNGLTPAQALVTISKMSGPHLDATLVRAFFAMQAERGLTGAAELAPERPSLTTSEVMV